MIKKGFEPRKNRVIAFTLALCIFFGVMLSAYAQDIRDLIEEELATEETTTEELTTEEESTLEETTDEESTIEESTAGEIETEEGTTAETTVEETETEEVTTAEATTEETETEEVTTAETTTEETTTEEETTAEETTTEETTTEETTTEVPTEEVTTAEETTTEETTTEETTTEVPAEEVTTAEETTTEETTTEETTTEVPTEEVTTAEETTTEETTTEETTTEVPTEEVTTAEETTTEETTTEETTTEETTTEETTTEETTAEETTTEETTTEETTAEETTTEETTTEETTTEETTTEETTTEETTAEETTTEETTTEETTAEETTTEEPPIDLPPEESNDVVLIMKEHSDYAYCTGKVSDVGSEGYYLRFVDTRAVMPVRLVGELLGFSVEYDYSSYAITIADDKGNKVEIQENSVVMKHYRNYEDEPFYISTLPVSVRNIYGRTYLPLRNVSESLSCQVEYVPDSDGNIFVMVYKASSGLNRLPMEKVTDLIEDFKTKSKPLEPVYKWLNIDDRQAGAEEAEFPGDTASSIPVLECYMDNGIKKPMVIVEYGVFMSKEDMLPVLMTLAKSGFHAVSFDTYGQGSRQNVERITLIDAVIRSDRDIDVLLSYYEKFRPEADTETFGITGFSMGGMSAFYCGAYGTRRPTAIVPIAGTPQWQKLWDTQQLARVLLPVKNGVYNKDAFADYNAYDGSRQPWAGGAVNNGLADLPMLMMIGRSDATVSPDGCRGLFNALQNDRENPNPNVRLMIYDGLSHTYTQTEIDEMTVFFKQQLIIAQQARS